MGFLQQWRNRQRTLRHAGRFQVRFLTAVLCFDFWFCCDYQLQQWRNGKRTRLICGRFQVQVPVAALYADLAQLGERLPYKQDVVSSSLAVGTISGCWVIGSPLDLGSSACRFKSCHSDCGRVKRIHHSGLITREIAGSTPVPATAAALLEAGLLHTQTGAGSTPAAASTGRRINRL